jgi:hypothetical protein
MPSMHELELKFEAACMACEAGVSKPGVGRRIGNDEGLPSRLKKEA